MVEEHLDDADNIDVEAVELQVQRYSRTAAHGC